MTNVIALVKEKTSIREEVAAYVEIDAYGKGLCPFHHNVNTPAFQLFEDNQSWYCFGCKEGGDVFSFLQKIENKTFGEVLRSLARKHNISVVLDPEAEAQFKRQQKIHEINTCAQEFWAAKLLWESPETIEYLTTKRGLTTESITSFGLGLAGDAWDELLNHLLSKGYTEEEIERTGLIKTGQVTSRHYDFFRNSIMLPIQMNGGIIGFGGRALPGHDEKTPKFINTSNTDVFKKRQVLFALSKAKPKIAETGTAVIVEGYLDAIVLHQIGVTNVVSTMGTAITEDHLKLLEKVGAKKIILVMDGDPAGVAAAISTATHEKSTHIYIVELPEGKDPDDLALESPENLVLMIDQAIPYISYLIRRAPQNMDAPTKADFINHILQFIDTVSPAEQAQYQTELMEKLGESNYRINPRCPHCHQRMYTIEEQKKWRKNGRK